MQKLGNYFNSELNEYIGTHLPKIMTSIDLDLLQVKKARNIIRFAEYKHKHEKIGYQQNEALKLLADTAKVINANPELFNNKKFQVVLIRGNKPFDEIEIYDYITQKTYFLNDKDKIEKFLTLE